MKLTQDFITKLNEHISNKLINVQYHPTLPLRIFKYSREAQYNCKFNLDDYKDFKESDLREWDEVLLTCRGLIVDEDYNVIAKGFNKFFNYEELPKQELESRQHMKPTIYEKVDGSLGILFYYADSWHITTMGGFYSDSGKIGQKILKEKYSHLHLNCEYTYLVEIISPHNRVVVHYENDDLILLNILDLDFKDVDLSENPGFTQIQEYNLDIKSLKQLNWEKKEGFVIKYPDGFRYKIKFDEYCRLHAIMTGLSEKHLLESLVMNKPISIMLENVPDEFYDWVMNLENMFTDWYKEIEVEINTYILRLSARFLDVQSHRKEVALFLKDKNTEHFGIIIQRFFLEVDDDQVSQYIWKKVEQKRKEHAKINGRLVPQTFFNKVGQDA